MQKSVKVGNVRLPLLTFRSSEILFVTQLTSEIRSSGIRSTGRDPREQVKGKIIALFAEGTQLRKSRKERHLLYTRKWVKLEHSEVLCWKRVDV